MGLFLSRYTFDVSASNNNLYISLEVLGLDLAPFGLV